MSFFDLSATTLDGREQPMTAYQGKVVLVVNTASECGFTPQYAGLEELWQEYRERGLMVLGFPSNDFGQQEPGTAEEIRGFCELNFHITFPLFAKVKTKGDGRACHVIRAAGPRRKPRPGGFPRFQRPIAS